MRLIIFIELLLFSTIYTQQLAAYSPGKKHFEKAYKLEKHDVSRSIYFYQKAISTGLKRKLRVAARWRLFFLYKNTKDFESALMITRKLPNVKKMKIVMNLLYRDMRLHWKISDVVLKDYLVGLRIIIKSTNSKNARFGNKTHLDEKNTASGDNEPMFMSYYRRALNNAPNNKEFRMEIINGLLKYGYEELAMELLSHTTILKKTQLLTQADRLFASSRLEASEKILFQLGKQNYQLNRHEKVRILYLLGRIFRARNKYYRAVVYFRLAARYAEEAEANRQKALAAYVLYRSGNPLQAMALLRGVPEPQEVKIRILLLVLRAEVDDDIDSFNELMRLKPWIISQKKSNPSSFILNRALERLTRKGQK